MIAVPVLADTDVLVDFLRGNAQAGALIHACADRLVLSAIVIAELYSGVKGKQEEETLDDVVALFRVVPVTADLARAGGLLKRTYGKSHGVGLADAVIAATVVSEKAELLTLNVRHYPMFKGLRPAYTKKTG
jgi:predicted nucleic acid-binding protein